MIAIPSHDETSRRIVRVAIATACVLSIPLLAMQFTAEVAWSPFDFATAGVLLFGSGLVYVLATRNVAGARSRIAIGVAVAAVLLIVWTELAVGIFGTPIAGS